MILAQTTPEPQVLWNFLIVVMFLAVLGDKLFSIVERVTGRKQKREVSFAEEFVTKPEFNDLKAVVYKHEEYGKERREKIYAMIRDGHESTDTKIEQFRAEVKEDLNGVHERVTQAVTKIAEVSGEIRQALKTRETRERSDF